MQATDVLVPKSVPKKSTTSSDLTADDTEHVLVIQTLDITVLAVASSPHFTVCVNLFSIQFCIYIFEARLQPSENKYKNIF